MSLDIFLHARKLLETIPKYEAHIHTDYSDGKNSIQEYVLKALGEDYLSLCFTEHVDFTTNWFDKYKDEIYDINGDLNVYCGIEVRAKDYYGNLNTNREILNESDVVMGVVHSIPSEDGLNVYNLQKLSKKEVLRLEYNATMGILKNKQVKILGHPMSNYEKYFEEAPVKLYETIFKTAKNKNIAVELNPAYHRNFSKILELSLDINPLITLGSNAHSISDFGNAFKKVGELIGQK